MATLSDTLLPGDAGKNSELKFFRLMAIIMSAIIVAGFSLNLAMGRSTFAVPLIYHVHAFVFFGWVALYLAQHWLITNNHIALHKKLGMLAYLWVPLMVVLGSVMLITVLRRTGAPFFFDQNEFLFSNSMLLFLFGAMTITALRVRRYTGWHRRLMLTAMTILLGPGVGRLLPMPLLMPYAWQISLIVTLIFPAIGMIADKRRNGRVHPAYYWAVGSIILMQVCSDIIAYTDWGIGMTQSVVAGTPGAERPMAAFLPPGF